MKFEKYTQEVTTLTTFVAYYCTGKHADVPKKSRSITLKYAGERAEPLEAVLCDECAETVAYAMARLQGCPFDDKPKCRKCPNPCYERPMWKKLAGIMRYSGMRFGMEKVRTAVRFWEDEPTAS